MIDDSFPLQHVLIHGHDVRFRMAGRGPTLLLIHGMAGSSRTWQPAMQHLVERYTVLAPDLLGHGESAKPMGDYSLGAFASGLRDLLSYLGIERVTAVGQSLGGGVAMQLAYQHPELCERLVLVGSGGLGREVNWILRALTLPGTEYVMPLLFPFFLRQRERDLGWIFDRLGLASPNLGEILRSYTALADADHRNAFMRTLRAVIDAGGQTVSAHDRLYLTSGMPTLVLWGAQDAIIPVDHAYAAYRAMPGSELAIFENAGHFPHVEEPERFAAVLGSFIQANPPATERHVPYRELLRGRLRASA